MEKTWKDEYVGSMESMKFSDSQKSEMVQFLVDADREGKGDADMWEGKRNKMNLPFKRLAIAGICVCILAVGTAGASASGLLKPVSEVFGNIFHLNEDTSEIAEKMGNSLNTSDSTAGVAISADAVLGDEYNYAVVFSIKTEDGTPLDSFMEQAPVDTWLFEYTALEAKPQTANGGWGMRWYFEDANPKDSSVQFVASVSNDNKINGKEIAATFSNLGYDKDGKFVTVAQGEWHMNFQMDFPDSTVELQAGQNLKTDVLNMVIRSVKISPIGYYIEFEDLDFKESEMVEGKENLKKENAFFDIPIALKLANGKTLTMPDGKSIQSSSIADSSSILNDGEDGAAYIHRGTFEKIIPIEDIEAICVGDIVIPL